MNEDHKVLKNLKNDMKNSKQINYNCSELFDFANDTPTHISSSVQNLLNHKIRQFHLFRASHVIGFLRKDAIKNSENNDMLSAGAETNLILYIIKQRKHHNFLFFQANKGNKYIYLVKYALINDLKNWHFKDAERESNLFDELSQRLVRPVGNSNNFPLIIAPVTPISMEKISSNIYSALNDYLKKNKKED